MSNILTKCGLIGRDSSAYVVCGSNVFQKSSDRTIKGIYTEIFSYSIKFINSVTASKIVKLHQKYLDISGDLINRKQIKKPPEKFVDSTMEALRREADKNFERLMKG